MCEERFDQVEKTYTYCIEGYPVAFVYHTLDGRALYSDGEHKRIPTSRVEAHEMARNRKSEIGAYM